MEELVKKRFRIDYLDKQIVEYLIERFEIVQEIREIKKKNDLKISDRNREEDILAMISSICEDKYCESVQEIYELIFKVSKDMQR